MRQQDKMLGEEGMGKAARPDGCSFWCMMANVLEPHDVTSGTHRTEEKASRLCEN